MGEYAKIRGTGERIKIGTCEDMLYLRADQVHRIWTEDGSVDPLNDSHTAVIRFRFPFPDEDDVEPGAFDDPFRAFRVWDAFTPPEIEHRSVQFTATYPANGYLVSLPCPEGPEYDAGDMHNLHREHGYKVHKNGYGGAVSIVQQRVWEGRLVTVCKCNGCGEPYRCETLEDLHTRSLLNGLALMAARERQAAACECDEVPATSRRADYYDEIARRIVVGYDDDAWARVVAQSTVR